jgi:hypothetical protein
MALAVAALLLGLVLASPAQAGDGRVEINQARALAGGVTPSDTPGFPVTIDTPGSYVLTGSLTVTDPNSGGIEILADSVSLDLNGFEIAGPIDCTGLGSARTCPPGSGDGIHGSANRVTVRDGGILGFRRGVEVGFRAQLRNLTVDSNRLEGIRGADHAIVTDCTAYQNLTGILTNEAVVVRNSSSSNELAGIGAGGGTTVGNTAYDNGRRGVSADGVVVGNQVHQNEQVGIFSGFGSVIVSNTVNENGHGVPTTGIDADGSAILGNAVNDNAREGIAGATAASLKSGYADNQLDGNNGGNINPQGGAAVEIGVNVCGGDTTCP